MITNFEKSKKYRITASQLIPGGAHTYSKGRDQFPENYPAAIVKGKGARLWDVDGNEYVDWGMALTSVILGYANEEINEVIVKEIENGVNFSLPSFIEEELAELYVKQIPCAEMVKFGKNGSDSTTAAVRLARAYTKKNIILRCGDHPFFSVNDWFIGDTDISSGVPDEIKKLTKRFKYNDIQDFKKVVLENEAEGIACAILQTSVTELPIQGYLQGLKDICDEHGIVLIFDEVVSGGRYHPKGSQFLFGVTPHLATFGKAMANGYSFSALCGERKIMELGGLEHKKERVFLMSTTYGGETHHLKVASKTIEILNRDDYAASKYIGKIGAQLKNGFNEITKRLDIGEYFEMKGIDTKPYLDIHNFKNMDATLMRNLLQQEVIKHGVMFLNFAPSLGHTDRDIAQTLEAFEKGFKSFKEIALDKNPRSHLVGDISKPVFRKYN